MPEIEQPTPTTTEDPEALAVENARAQLTEALAECESTQARLAEAREEMRLAAIAADIATRRAGQARDRVTELQLARTATTEATNATTNATEAHGPDTIVFQEGDKQTVFVSGFPAGLR